MALNDQEHMFWMTADETQPKEGPTHKHNKSRRSKPEGLSQRLASRLRAILIHLRIENMFTSLCLPRTNNNSNNNSNARYDNIHEVLETSGCAACQYQAKEWRHPHWSAVGAQLEL